MARTIKLVPEELKWNAEHMESLKITPYDDNGVAKQY